MATVSPDPKSRKRKAEEELDAGLRLRTSAFQLTPLEIPGVVRPVLPSLDTSYQPAPVARMSANAGPTSHPRQDELELEPFYSKHCYYLYDFLFRPHKSPTTEQRKFLPKVREPKKGDKWHLLADAGKGERRSFGFLSKKDVPTREYASRIVEQLCKHLNGYAGSLDDITMDVEEYRTRPFVFMQLLLHTAASSVLPTWQRPVPPPAVHLCSNNGAVSVKVHILDPKTRELKPLRYKVLLNRQTPVIDPPAMAGVRYARLEKLILETCYSDYTGCNDIPCRRGVAPEVWKGMEKYVQFVAARLNWAVLTSADAVRLITKIEADMHICQRSKVIFEEEGQEELKSAEPLDESVVATPTGSTPKTPEIQWSFGLGLSVQTGLASGPHQPSLLSASTTPACTPDSAVSTSVLSTASSQSSLWLTSISPQAHSATLPHDWKLVPKRRRKQPVRKKCQHLRPGEKPSALESHRMPREAALKDGLFCDVRMQRSQTSTKLFPNSVFELGIRAANNGKLDQSCINIPTTDRAWVLSLLMLIYATKQATGCYLQAWRAAQRKGKEINMMIPPTTRVDKDAADQASTTGTCHRCRKTLPCSELRDDYFGVLFCGSCFEVVGEEHKETPEPLFAAAMLLVGVNALLEEECDGAEGPRAVSEPATT